MSDRLREALTWIDAMQADLRAVYPNGKTPPGGPEYVAALAAAARRFLALTETGPDYDKADDKAMELGYVDIVWDDLIAIVDAALADYLTSES